MGRSYIWQLDSCSNLLLLFLLGMKKWIDGVNIGARCWDLLLMPFISSLPQVTKQWFHLQFLLHFSSFKNMGIIGLNASRGMDVQESSFSLKHVPSIRFLLIYFWHLFPWILEAGKFSLLRGLFHFVMFFFSWRDMENVHSFSFLNMKKHFFSLTFCLLGGNVSWWESPKVQHVISFIGIPSNSFLLK